MGEFTGTPEVTKRMDFSSDTEQSVDTSTETETSTETGAETGTETETGETAAQAQGTQTSQQTSAETESDDKKPDTETEVTAKPKKQYDTDVSGVKCDDQVRIGSDKFPCFDVSQDEFYQNMQDGRRRLRFTGGSNVQKYMQGTKYNRPFFIRHTDERGKTYVRKIK
jgi:hypothetical protein